MTIDLAGHNATGITLTIELRLFNTLSRYGGKNGSGEQLEVPAGSTVGDIIKMLNIPRRKVYLALRNGRDVSPGLYGDINMEAFLEEGDVTALSGPVPYSYGYGAPVV